EVLQGLAAVRLGLVDVAAVVVPEPLKGDQLKLEGHALKVVDLKGPSPDRTVLWIPSLKTVVGGVLVESGSHVWTADTQTQASRQAWVAMLDRIEALQPRRVVLGHFTGEEPKGLDGVRFTRDYLKALEAELPKARDSAALVEAMKRRYPNLPGEEGLELSAKVLKGEMQWP
ncbi:MBL fold metallo-hydrolase, partial [Pseudomonas aeruginosa]|uniref:MBL fold metallo-hydrolase n=1 Tax=Pseudomonas aeruginosa TaxID=287 RepID=UPI00396A5D11